MAKKENKIIKCEVCSITNAVVIHEKVYYCPDCYIYENKIPMTEAIVNLNLDGKYDKLKN